MAVTSLVSIHSARASSASSRISATRPLKEMVWWTLGRLNSHGLGFFSQFSGCSTCSPPSMLWRNNPYS
jgi:hypothetical protein